MSRAFGDRLLKRYVVADPDILEEELSSEDHLLILATDGLWDVISNQDAIMLVHVRQGLAWCQRSGINSEDPLHIPLLNMR